MTLEQNIERIATALEAIAKSAILASNPPMFAPTEPKAIVVGKAAIEAAQDEADAEAAAAEKIKRDDVKKELDSLGISYSARQNTVNLVKKLEAAKAKAKEIPEIQKEKPLVNPEDEFSFDAIKGEIGPWSAASKENAAKVKAFVKEFGPAAKLSELTLAQRKEVLTKFRALVNGKTAEAKPADDDFLG